MAEIKLGLPIDNQEDLNIYLTSVYVEILKEKESDWVWVTGWSGLRATKVDMNCISETTSWIYQAGGVITITGDKVRLGKLWPDTKYYLAEEPIPQAVYLERRPQRSVKQGLHYPSANLFNPLDNIPMNFKKALLNSERVLGDVKKIAPILKKGDVGFKIDEAIARLGDIGLSYPLTNREYCLSLSVDKEGYDLWFRNARVAIVNKRMVARMLSKTMRQEVVDNFGKQLEVI